MQELSICIVNYNQHSLLNYNISNLISNNPDIDIKFFVCENGDRKLTDSANLKVVGPLDKSLAMETGVPYITNPGKVGRFSKSNHHSIGFEKCAKLVETRYLLLLDLDCFLYYKLSDLINYVNSNKIAVIGPPWGNNISHQNIQKFTEPTKQKCPATLCTLIDRNLYTEEIVIDKRLAKYPAKNEDGTYNGVIDTALPFCQSLYKYKFEMCTTCTSYDCTICKKAIPRECLESLSRHLEIFYLNNKLYAAHFHYNGNPNFDKVYGFDFKRVVYHPLNNFYEKISI